MRYFTRKLALVSDILWMIVGNPCEENIFESNHIEEQHERMKLQNEEVVLKDTQNFGNDLNRPMAVLGMRDF